MGRMGKQGSQDLDSSQLMKDLYDSMERETDLKDQFQLMEEEAKTKRKKVEELEEENENLSIQLKKMSAAQATKGKEGFREFKGSPITEEEAELKVQLDLNNQELSVLKKKVHDMEDDNEHLLIECGKLSEELRQKEILLNVLPEPSSPNYYYEDKIKDMKIEADELRWKIIEKEREIERLNAQCVLKSRQSRLKKSRSLEGDHYPGNVDLKKQMDAIQQENAMLKEKVIRLSGGKTDRADVIPIQHKMSTYATNYPGEGEEVKDEKLRALQLRINRLETHRQLSPLMESKRGESLKSGKALYSARKKSHDPLNQPREYSVSRASKNRIRGASRAGVSSLGHKSAALLPHGVHLGPLIERPSSLPSPSKTLPPGGSTQPLSPPGETREELMDQILDMEEEVGK